MIRWLLMTLVLSYFPRSVKGYMTNIHLPQPFPRVTIQRTVDRISAGTSTSCLNQAKGIPSTTPDGAHVTLPHSLTPVEVWCTSKINTWYSKSLKLKCPFIRRRMADLLDAADTVMRFLIIRHKSLDLIGPPPSCRSSTMSKVKHRGLSIEEILRSIEKDWRTDTKKGYYITGRLNTTIYRDDCLFDGPDPDMPVRGLRKYLNAASHLFDHSLSQAELLSLEITEEDSITVKWKLQGVLHLPWRPKLPVWTGSTTYHLDENNLVFYHEEKWDVSVFQAFTQTLLPDLAQLLWGSKNAEALEVRS